MQFIRIRQITHEEKCQISFAKGVRFLTTMYLVPSYYIHYVSDMLQSFLTDVLHCRATAST